MTPIRPRVLFLSHSASRNGATILLLGFLRWLRDQVDWDIEVVVNGRGPLLDDFRAIARTHVWRDPQPRLDNLLPPTLDPLKRLIQDIHARLSLPSGHIDLIYANTAAVAPLVQRLATGSRPLLWHVHELTYAIDVTLTRSDWMERFRSATRFIAVSNAVRQALIADRAINPERIDVINGFTETGSMSREKADATRQRLRRELGIPSDAFVVGGCGSLGWRKGSDVFLQIARESVLASNGGALFFLWVGGERGEPAALEFLHDMRRLGIDPCCRLVPTTPEVQDYYHVMDTFALTSREDPFPLVVLEAAEHAIPTICFADAGGAGEFVEDDGGFRVSYLDVHGFAQRILQLNGDRATATRLGKRAQRKVRENLHVQCQGPKLLQSIQRCLINGGSAVLDTTSLPDSQPQGKGLGAD